ncbi:YihY/virulence factor BrkB family protein [Novosphingopyxis sp.]|uniref:YihY/virulence factor BrkB family protein n=1 Tax=Novosphingopyxis sp. TaxID=2709690 RepID=UPI003B5909F4
MDDAAMPDGNSEGGGHLQAGQTAVTPWQLPPRAWWQILKRCFVMNGFHNLPLLAAGVAFYTFLSVTPLLASTVLLYGLIGDAGTVERSMRTVIELVPADAARLIQEQLSGAVETSGGVAGIALAVSLFLAIFGASRASKGLIGALNIINEEHETRSIVKFNLTSLGLTLAAVFVAVVGIGSASVFAVLQTIKLGFADSALASLIKVLTWVFALLLGSFGFGLINRFGPDRRAAKWQWLTPGSLLSTMLWIAVSFGFSLYVAFISDYNATYGSLSGIVVFLMWLFLSCYALLLGALLNAEAERQTATDTTVGRERPSGERGAVMADLHLADDVDAKVLEKRRVRRANRAARKASRGDADLSEEAQPN